MTRKNPVRGRMTLIFTVFVFFILLTSLAVTGLLLVILSKLGILYNTVSDLPLRFFLMIAVVSLIVGSIASVFFGQLPISPINRIIKAMQQLSQGDFSVRLPVSGIREMRQVSESFNKMAQELGSMQIMRMDFANNFSHEFKTPLVSIRGFARLLKYQQPDPAEKEEYLDAIIAETDRMSRLSDNIMRLSQLDNQSILAEKKEFNLAEQLRRVVLLTEPKLAEKEIDLVMEINECRYVGSEELLNQVWINLLDNAIKFTQPGGRVGIGLLRREKQVEVTVWDNGCGMNSEVQQHIFEKFYQADTSRSVEGHGVGLAIVHRIVKISGGRITVESKEKEGSCFRVLLPIEEE